MTDEIFKGVDPVRKTYQQGLEDMFNLMKPMCQHSHFTYGKDSHYSGHNYCILKGFDCVCSFENCAYNKVLIGDINVEE